MNHIQVDALGSLRHNLGTRWTVSLTKTRRENSVTEQKWKVNQAKCYAINKTF